MRWAAVLPLVLLFGCAHPPAPRSAYAPPRPADSAWVELTSEHFVLRSDLGVREARAALRDFEQVYATLARTMTGGEGPPGQIMVVLLGDERRFSEIAPPGASGYFMPRQAEDPDPQPTIVLFGRMLEAGTLVATTQRRFRHELAHRFLDHQVQDAPPWLAEGIAEFYSTVAVTDDAAIVGTLKHARLLRLDIHAGGSLVDGFAETRVDLRTLPRVAELLAADFDRFHAPGRELASYAGAWLFVHMLMNGPYNHSSRLLKLVELLASGSSMAAAWEQAFFGIPLWRLEAELRAYVARPELDERTIAVSLPPARPPRSARLLLPYEAPLTLAEVRPWRSREDIVFAGRALGQARLLAGERGSDELHYWSALYAERWRRFDEAELELRAAIALAPRRPRYWLALAGLLAERGDEANLADVIARLRQLAASSAPALNFLARYYSDKGEAALGLPFAERAVAVERSCAECQETLQLLRGRLAPPHVLPDACFQPTIF